MIPSSIKLSSVASVLLFSCCFAVSAQEKITLEEFVSSVDRTPITFVGSVTYDEMNSAFRFISQAEDWFGLSVDAGRDVREKMESGCTKANLFQSYEDLCKISATGTVEIRGGNVFLSIETLDAFTPQKGS
ncbi:hypothetical protein ABMC88_03080 [Sulfitobacter sp. HNIBRBA2951]|uniref:hypothetical protein n=1 Tax=Sulfitobacter aquimarinus TaxID=3158557 RepID=UPI0032E0337D